MNTDAEHVLIDSTNVADYEFSAHTARLGKNFSIADLTVKEHAIDRQPWVAMHVLCGDGRTRFVKVPYVGPLFPNARKSKSPPPPAAQPKAVLEVEEEDDLFELICAAAANINRINAAGTTAEDFYERLCQLSRPELASKIRVLLRTDPFPAGAEVGGKTRHVRNLLATKLAPAQTAILREVIPASVAEAFIAWATQEQAIKLNGFEVAWKGHFEERCKAEWKSSPTLQAEFPDIRARLGFSNPEWANRAEAGQPGWKTYAYAMRNEPSYRQQQQEADAAYHEALGEQFQIS